jgi:hypothetical protein
MGERGSWVAERLDEIIGDVQLHTAEGAPVAAMERGTASPLRSSTWSGDCLSTLLIVVGVLAARSLTF